jgi:AraC-like DNA-binding protein
MEGMRAKGLVLTVAAGGRIDDAKLYGVLFAGAAAAFCCHTLLGGRLGATSQVLAIIGDATCGWSWLLVRALFQRPAARRPWWPLAVVVAMVVIGAVLRLGDGSSSPLLRMADNAEGLASSTLLLLAALEPLRGIGGALAHPEKRFRIGFTGAYVAMLTIAVLWIDNAPVDSETARFGGAIKALCALAALAGMGFAIWYRAGHPIPDFGKARRPVRSDDHDLGARILHALRGEEAFVRPDLKVADLARHLGEPDYKVSQCITGTLGFRNFNHMTNAFRLAEAKRKLADPGFDHLPILTIALDCGFGSIGPFNRGFKAETGATPKHFRKAARSDGASSR